MELDLRLNDTLKELPLIASESVDVVVTSPDYNLGIKYKTHQSVRALNDYMAWAAKWGAEIMRVLKPRGHFFLNISGAPSRPLLPHRIAIQFSEFAVLQNTFHWIKSITVRKDKEYVSVGHFKPLTSIRYVNDLHEYVFHFTKSGMSPIDRKSIGVPYTDKTNIKRFKHAGGSDVRCRGNTLFVPYKTIQSRSKQRPHPATFPPELALMLLKLAGAGPESVVLDPFVGLGNSGVAAKTIPVKKFIGIDIEDYYIAQSKEKICS